MIQTFPDNFIFVENKTDVEQMIGNAVPVSLARFVANANLEFTENPNEIRKTENGQFTLF